jgi:hypothetical protein
MREITDHKIAGLNDALNITVLDEPGHGGACHEYRIAWYPMNEGPDTVGENDKRIRFQNGPIKEHGVNGITQEALLAIVLDRLRCFQAGPYACTENGEAALFVQAALETLQKRTAARLARGVEGTSAPTPNDPLAPNEHPMGCRCWECCPKLSDV